MDVKVQRSSNVEQSSGKGWKLLASFPGSARAQEPGNDAKNSTHIGSEVICWNLCCAGSSVLGDFRSRGGRHSWKLKLKKIVPQKYGIMTQNNTMPWWCDALTLLWRWQRRFCTLRWLPLLLLFSLHMYTEDRQNSPHYNLQNRQVLSW